MAACLLALAATEPLRACQGSGPMGHSWQPQGAHQRLLVSSHSPAGWDHQFGSWLAG